MILRSLIRQLGERIFRTADAQWTSPIRNLRAMPTLGRLSFPPRADVAV